MKKQQELERQMEKQRQLEKQREEQRQKMMEQREVCVYYQKHLSLYHMVVFAEAKPN